MHEAIVEVALEASLAVELVHENVVVIMSLIELSESLNALTGVIETSSKNESFVGELFAVGEREFVGIRVKLGDFGTRLDLGPGVDHGRKSTSVHLEGLDMGLQDTKIGLGLHPDGVLRDNGDLEVGSTGVSLEIFGQGAAVGTTFHYFTTEVSIEFQINQRVEIHSRWIE